MASRMLKRARASQPRRCKPRGLEIWIVNLLYDAKVSLPYASSFSLFAFVEDDHSPIFAVNRRVPLVHSPFRLILVSYIQDSLQAENILSANGSQPAVAALIDQYRGVGSLIRRYTHGTLLFSTPKIASLTLTCR